MEQEPLGALLGGGAALLVGLLWVLARLMLRGAGRGVEGSVPAQRTPASTDGLASGGQHGSGMQQQDVEAPDTGQLFAMTSAQDPIHVSFFSSVRRADLQLQLPVDAPPTKIWVTIRDTAVAKPCPGALHAAWRFTPLYTTDPQGRVSVIAPLQPGESVRFDLMPTKVPRGYSGVPWETNFSDRELPITVEGVTADGTRWRHRCRAGAWQWTQAFG